MLANQNGNLLSCASEPAAIPRPPSTLGAVPERTSEVGTIALRSGGKRSRSSSESPVLGTTVKSAGFADHEVGTSMSRGARRDPLRHGNLHPLS
jgi:hypothetical protein